MKEGIDIQQAHELTPPILAGVSSLLVEMNPHRTALSEPDLAAYLAWQGTHLLLAWDGDSVAGMISVIMTLRIDGGSRAEIRYLVVGANYRGRGIGGALLERARELAEHQQATYIQLASNASRSDAHRLYQRHGYTVHDTTLFHLGLDK